MSWLMFKLTPIAFLLAAILALSAGGAHAANPIKLLSRVDLETDGVTLAQLLPQTAPLALRRASAKVPVGPAPSYGSVRVFTDGDIRAAMQAAGLPPRAFVIPGRVAVCRTSRALTRGEVFRAIESSFRQKWPGSLLPFSQDDLEISSTLRVHAKDAALKVVALRYDEMLHREIFRLVSESSSLVPFEVLVKMSKPKNAAANLALPLHIPEPSPVLVDPRYSAHLSLISQDAEIQMRVRPLQRGHLGDAIRVRMPQNGRTFLARVTGPGTLEAFF
jgi:Chaperone for flagella basal body P-ring formation